MRRMFSSVVTKNLRQILSDFPISGVIVVDRPEEDGPGLIPIP
jgi:hypothetical protein